MKQKLVKTTMLAVCIAAVASFGSGCGVQPDNAGHAPTMLNVEQEDLEHYFLRLVGMDGDKAR